MQTGGTKPITVRLGILVGDLCLAMGLWFWRKIIIIRNSNNYIPADIAAMYMQVSTRTIIKVFANILTVFPTVFWNK